MSDANSLVDGYAFEDDMARYLYVLLLLAAVGRYDAVRCVKDKKEFERGEEEGEERVECEGVVKVCGGCVESSWT
jgi:hypothetical protein